MAREKKLVIKVLGMSKVDEQPTELFFEEESMKGIFDYKRDKATLFIGDKKIISLNYSELRELLDKPAQKLNGLYLNHLNTKRSSIYLKNEESHFNVPRPISVSSPMVSHTVDDKRQKSVQELKKLYYGQSLMQPITAKASSSKSKQEKKCILI